MYYNIIIIFFSTALLERRIVLSVGTLLVVGAKPPRGIKENTTHTRIGAWTMFGKSTCYTIHFTLFAFELYRCR